VAVDRATGLPASTDTPPERLVHKLYTVLPPEADEWAREQGLPEPPLPPAQRIAWTEGQRSLPWSADGKPLVMSSPASGAAYRLDPGLPRNSQRIVVSACPGAGWSLVEVTLLLDGRPLASFSAPPYETLWALEPGKHVLSAAAIDADGQQVLGNEVWVEVHQ
jgi:hypothetical protein